MVAADAGEMDIVGYRKSIATALDESAYDSRRTRGAAIALWHIAKAALVRDLAE